MTQPRILVVDDHRDIRDGVAAYLASRAGDYVVGETIVVDGGVVASSRL